MKGRGAYYWLGVLLLLIICAAVFHEYLLTKAASVLIHEDKLEKADAVFVLGGNAWERGKEAARLYRQGYASRIICTGEHIYNDLKIVKIHLSESGLTRLQVINSGVPPDSVISLPKATSTREEAFVILDYARSKGYKKVILVSSSFHTRRVRYSFSKVFKSSGISIIIHGAGATYNESNWWKLEAGLIAVNNEYIKLFYYILNY